MECCQVISLGRELTNALGLKGRVISTEELHKIDISNILSWG